MVSIAQRLEQYTLKRPGEVLLVNVEVDGELDEIAVFKGFSSSLVRSTAFDPDVPVLPESAKILTIDRLEAPFNPADPRYISEAIDWERMQTLLAEVGV